METTEQTVIVERFVVTKGTHLGPIRRTLNKDSVIEWNPATETMRVDGAVIIGGGDVSPAEAIRMIRVLVGRPNEIARPMESTETTDGASWEAVKPKTSTMTILPVVGCFQAAAEFLASRNMTLEFGPSNGEQEAFLSVVGLSDVSDVRRLVDGARDALRWMADDDVETINVWLRGNGFDIQLDPVTDGFYVASILDVLVEWMKEGSKTTVECDGDSYPAVSLKDGVVIRHTPEVHPWPVAMVATKAGERVFMAKVDSVPEGRFGLIELLDVLRKVKGESTRYEGVVFPMVDYDGREDISFLEGLHVHADWFVAQAVQQTKFRMNERGARAENAAAMTMLMGGGAMEEVPYVINGPFVLWMERTGSPLPLFVGTFCTDSWAPAGLD